MLEFCHDWELLEGVQSDRRFIHSSRYGISIVVLHRRPWKFLSVSQCVVAGHHRY
jgi:hypothetical protein